MIQYPPELEKRLLRLRKCQERGLGVDGTDG
jgi:hypothetical protein